jgi:hypothetical protein
VEVANKKSHPAWSNLAHSVQVITRGAQSSQSRIGPHRKWMISFSSSTCAMSRSLSLKSSLFLCPVVQTTRVLRESLLHLLQEAHQTPTTKPKGLAYPSRRAEARRSRPDDRLGKNMLFLASRGRWVLQDFACSSLKEGSPTSFRHFAMRSRASTTFGLSRKHGLKRRQVRQLHGLILAHLAEVNSRIKR